MPSCEASQGTGSVAPPSIMRDLTTCTCACGMSLGRHGGAEGAEGMLALDAEGDSHEVSDVAGVESRGPGGAPASKSEPLAGGCLIFR